MRLPSHDSLIVTGAAHVHEQHGNRGGRVSAIREEDTWQQGQRAQGTQDRKEGRLSEASRSSRIKLRSRPQRAACKTVSIDGKPLALTVTQAELERVSDLQASVWLQARCAINFALKLEERIRYGATIEPGRYSWVPKFTMVDGPIDQME